MPLEYVARCTFRCMDGLKWLPQRCWISRGAIIGLHEGVKEKPVPRGSPRWMMLSEVCTGLSAAKAKIPGRWWHNSTDLFFTCSQYLSLLSIIRELNSEWRSELINPRYLITSEEGATAFLSWISALSGYICYVMIPQFYFQCDVVTHHPLQQLAPIG